MAKKNQTANTTAPNPTVSAPAPRRRAAAPKAGNGGTQPQLTHEQIAQAAYRRYLSRGGGHGRDFEDWLEAERELLDSVPVPVTSRRRSTGL